MTPATYEFRWASPTGAHNMPAVEELEYLGYRVVGRDPRYGSVLMLREVEA